MARSSRHVALGWASAAALAACGQLTGLSDDYRYDLDAGAAAPGEGGLGEAGGRPDGGGPDARADGSADRCDFTERTRAGTELTTASAGTDVTQACKTCLADSCCTEVDTCSGNVDCSDSMKCVFGCQKSGNPQNRQQCVDNCRGSFATVLGPCLRSACGAPCPF